MSNGMQSIVHTIRHRVGYVHLKITKCLKNLEMIVLPFHHAP